MVFSSLLAGCLFNSRTKIHRNSKKDSIWQRKGRRLRTKLSNCWGILKLLMRKLWPRCLKSWLKPWKATINSTCCSILWWTKLKQFTPTMKRSSCFWTRKTPWAFLSPCQKFKNLNILKQKRINALMNILPIVNNCKTLIFQRDQNNFDVKSKFFKRGHK